MEDVNAKIIKDGMFAANFTLESRRQSLHEKITASGWESWTLFLKTKYYRKAEKKQFISVGIEIFRKTCLTLLKNPWTLSG